MTPFTLPEPWLALLGDYAGIVLTSVIGAFAVFRFSSEKWLTARFDERLASYKHMQQKELEQVRFEINALFDRRVKLHQKEFEILPEIWARANDALNAMTPVGVGFSMIPNVDRLTEPQIDNLLDESDLAEWQKSELRSSAEKTRYYSVAMSMINYQKAEIVRLDFNQYLAKNAIFLQDAIRDKFDVIGALLFEVSIECRPGQQRQEYDKALKLHKEGPTLMKLLEHDVKLRLWQS